MSAQVLLNALNKLRKSDHNLFKLLHLKNHIARLNVYFFIPIEYSIHIDIIRV